MSRPSLADFLSQSDFAGLPPVGLVDVGCSGGLPARFAALGDRLSGLGLDRSETAVRELVQRETSSRRLYHAVEVVAPPEESVHLAAARSDDVAGRSTYALTRSSAYAATLQKAGLDPFGPVLDAPSDATFASCADRRSDPFFAHHTHRMTGANDDGSPARSTLDDILATVWPHETHVLKVDTDGFELDVLLGARELLSRPALGFVEIECQFHGPVGPWASVFSNIDALLRGHGFSLFQLRPVTYGRRDLPLPFVSPSLAATVSGQVQWADALYARDVGDPRYAAKHGVEPDRASLLRMAVLFDLYGMPDCAAELLARVPGSDALTDHLAKRVYGQSASGAELRRRFTIDPESFRADRLRRPTGR